MSGEEQIFSTNDEDGILRFNSVVQPEEQQQIFMRSENNAS